MTDSNTTSNQPEDAHAEVNAKAQKAVGQLLRETRQQAGLDIADVARVLRISQKYLEALEDGRNADLPGATYAIGFVRSYAEHLHLDGDEIVRRYKAQAEGVDAKTNLVFPKPIPDSGVPGAAVLGLGVVVAALAYGVWYYNSMSDDVVTERVAPVPEHLAAADDAAADSSGPTSAQAPEQIPEQPSEQASAQVSASATAPDSASPTAQAVQAPASPMSQDTQGMGETAPVGPDADDASGVQDVQDVQDVAQATPSPSLPVPQASDSQAAEAEAQSPQASGAASPAPETAEEGSDGAREAASAASVMPAEPTQPVTGGAAQTATVAPGEMSGGDGAAAAAQSGEGASAQTPGASAASAEAGAPSGVGTLDVVPDGPSRITVRAKSNSWIQVRDETLDRLLFTRLLRAGDEYEVPNRSGLHLMTGNAGALELVVDGQVIPPLGAVGEVRRNVELDPDKLKAGTAIVE